MEEKVLEVLREVVYEVTGIGNLTMDTEFVNDLADAIRRSIYGTLRIWFR